MKNLLYSMLLFQLFKSVCSYSVLLAIEFGNINGIHQHHKVPALKIDTIGTLNCFLSTDQVGENHNTSTFRSIFRQAITDSYLVHVPKFAK